LLLFTFQQKLLNRILAILLRFRETTNDSVEADQEIVGGIGEIVKQRIADVISREIPAERIREVYVQHFSAGRSFDRSPLGGGAVSIRGGPPPEATNHTMVLALLSKLGIPHSRTALGWRMER